jgi:biopolymer transport protein ExbB/TolQ
MGSLYQTTVQLFYQLSNVFFWPVSISLILLFLWALLDLGRLIYRVVQRASEAKTDLPALARRMAERQAERQGDLRNLLEGLSISPSLQRFWRRVEARLASAGSSEHVDLWLEEVLQQEELEVTSHLDRSRAMVRIGPMLGLAGTIIPLGPALQSLLTGDMAGMVNHLVVGFGAVVCGLVLSGIAYVITLVRERWTRVELKEMENLCELYMRARQAKPLEDEVRHARL